MTRAELKNRALGLPEQERLALAEELWASIENPNTHPMAIELPHTERMLPAIVRIGNEDLDGLCALGHGASLVSERIEPEYDARLRPSPETPNAAQSGGVNGFGMSDRGNGGAEGNRTLDLLNAIQALSQLSYGPTCWDAAERYPAAGRGLYRHPLGVSTGSAGKIRWQWVGGGSAVGRQWLEGGAGGGRRWGEAL